MKLNRQIDRQYRMMNTNDFLNQLRKINVIVTSLNLILSITLVIENLFYEAYAYHTPYAS